MHMHVRRVLMIDKVDRRVKRASMMGKVRRREDAQFSRLFVIYLKNSVFIMNFKYLYFSI